MAFETINGATTSFQNVAQSTKVTAASKDTSAVTEQQKMSSVGNGNLQSQQTKTNENTEDHNQDKRTDEEKLQKAIDHANTKMKINRTHCEFSYHEETKRISIKIMDDDTEEVIKEIPAEDTLKMIQRVWELAGLMVDEKR